MGLVVGRVKRDDSVRRSLLGGGERGDIALAIMITDLFFSFLFNTHIYIYILQPLPLRWQSKSVYSKR